MKKLFFVMPFVLVFLFSCTNRNLSYTNTDRRVITDLNGTQVEIPGTVTRIAAFCSQVVLMLYMLDEMDLVVATTQVLSGQPWFVKLYPEIANIPALIRREADPVNIEELFALNPCVVFSRNEAQIEVMRNAGLSVIFANAASWNNVKQTMEITARVLNHEPGSLYSEFIRYLDERINYISSVVGTIDYVDRPRVYFSRSSATAESRFSTFGRNIMIDDWITLSGGVNVMHDIAEGAVNVTVEEFIALDPEIILVRGSNAHGAGGGERIRQYFLNDPALSEVSAIRNGNIFLCPIGFDFWSFTTVENALQIQWASQLFHPDLFPDADMVAQARDFYQRFFRHNFSDDDIIRMKYQLWPEDSLP